MKPEPKVRRDGRCKMCRGPRPHQPPARGAGVDVPRRPVLLGDVLASLLGHDAAVRGGGWTGVESRTSTSKWQLVDRADPATRRPLIGMQPAGIGAPGFVPPGRCVVLRTPEADAFWITRRTGMGATRMGGSVDVTAFRNESSHLSSELIAEAIAATLSMWPSRRN